MKRKTFLLIIFIIPIVLLMLFLSNPKAPAVNSKISIQLRGSETVMGLVQNGAEAYMSENPDVVVSVSGGDTDRGIKSLIDGTSQIAMASAGLNEELLFLARERDVTLVKHVIAYDAIVPFVNLDNPVSSLSMEQLKRIYTSQISNWKQVAGNNSPIALATRSLSSGTYEGWKLLVIGDKAVISPHAIPMDVKPMKEFIAKNRNGIGYGAFNTLDNTIKPLAIGGVFADSESIRSGKYPLRRELILYTRNDASPDTIKFVEYIKKNVPRYAEKSGVFPIS